MAKSKPAGAFLYPCRTLQAHEREIIATELKRQGGNKARVAQILDISKSTLYAKLALYGLKGLKIAGVRRPGRGGGASSGHRFKK